MIPRAGAKPPAPYRVWAMSTGEAGTHRQALGLAHAVSPGAEARVIQIPRPLAALSPALFSRVYGSLYPFGAGLSPPWPEVLISCGRRAALASMAIQRRNTRPMVSVHIQPPPDPDAFDLVVAMPHDRLTGDNVICTPTALHDVHSARLVEAASVGDRRIMDLPRPWTGVLVGGAAGRRPFTPVDAGRLADQLDDLRQVIGGSLLITASRRTPPEVIAALGWRFADDTATFIWDGAGPNPYLPMLALCDRLVVTSDSISMVSEALATTAEVWIFELAGGPRHARFLETLMETRQVARLGAPPPAPRDISLDATPAIAEAVIALLNQKRGHVARTASLALSR